jgi:hypothetical protein
MATNGNGRSPSTEVPEASTGAADVEVLVLVLVVLVLELLVEVVLLVVGGVSTEVAGGSAGMPGTTAAGGPTGATATGGGAGAGLGAGTRTGGRVIVTVGGRAVVGGTRRTGAGTVMVTRGGTVIVGAGRRTVGRPGRITVTPGAWVAVEPGGNADPIVPVLTAGPVDTCEGRQRTSISPRVLATAIEWSAGRWQSMSVWAAAVAPGAARPSTAVVVTTPAANRTVRVDPPALRRRRVHRAHIVTERRMRTAPRPTQATLATSATACRHSEQ